VPKNVEQIIDYLFIDTYKSNKIKIGKKEVNDSEMGVRYKTTKFGQYRIYQS